MIELVDVEKTVRSGGEPLAILKKTTLTIRDGEFVAILGPSGSGKSTLLGLIAGLDAPTAGTIRVHGRDVGRMGEDALAALRGSSIGIVFQSFHLVPSLTALENVAVPLEIAGKKGAMARARELLGSVGLAERVTHYPSQLSGGEQQRVAIARAFANEPSILLADEPTGNLDSKTGSAIVELLLEMNRTAGATLVLVTHDPALARLAARRVVLADGAVVEDTLADGSTAAAPAPAAADANGANEADPASGAAPSTTVPAFEAR